MKRLLATLLILASAAAVSADGISHLAQPFPHDIAISNNNTGGSSPSFTYDARGSRVLRVDCQDPDGCNLDFGESNVRPGNVVWVTAIGSNAVSIDDQSGVITVVSGSATLSDSTDWLIIGYEGDIWREVARPGNLTSHDNLTGVSASDHHPKYTDSEAQSAINADGDHGSTASHNYYTDEKSQDAWNTMQAAGTHSLISYSYDDAGDAFSATVTSDLSQYDNSTSQFFDTRGTGIGGTGTTVTATLGTQVDNSELVNSSVSYGGVSVSLGGSDGTPAFDLQDASNFGDAVDIIVDTEANKPAAGTANRIFIDTTGNEIERDTGSAWQVIGQIDTTDDTVQDTELSGGNADTDDLAEGATNKYDDDNVVGDVDNTEIGEDISLANGGTGASLVDPNADRIMFWDDSDGATEFLTPGSNLTITGNTLDASGGSSFDVQTVTSNNTLNVSSGSEMITVLVTTVDDAGGETVNLPDYGASEGGFQVVVKDVGGTANTANDAITVDTQDAGEEIRFDDGGGDTAPRSIANGGESETYVFDGGSVWYIINDNTGS